MSKSNTRRRPVKAAAPKDPTPAEQSAARATAAAQAARVAAMSPAERRWLIAEHEVTLAGYAPTAEAAASDLLAVLQAVGLEFVRRYYPDATGATFHVSRYAQDGPPLYSASLPVPVPRDAGADRA